MNQRLLIAGAIAVVAFGGAYVMFASSQSARPSQPPAQAAAPFDVDQVLVARQDLPMGTVVNENAIGWQPWPKAAVSDLMIAKSTSANAIKDLAGSLTREALMRGEPIRRDKLVKSDGGGFMSAILPSGMRAVAIKIDNTGDSSAGGFILPNDRVDVVRVARDDEATKARGVEVFTSQTILANVRVLAIGQNVEEQNGKKVVTGGNATLELNPDQVNLIVLAQHSGTSNLHLVLRSLADSGGPAQTVVGAGGGSKDNLTVVRFGAVQQVVR
jgi:pilus assembly protein CpaB